MTAGSGAVLVTSSYSESGLPVSRPLAETLNTYYHNKIDLAT
jgi:hypothetical protein